MNASDFEYVLVDDGSRIKIDDNYSFVIQMEDHYRICSEEIIAAIEEFQELNRE